MAACKSFFRLFCSLRRDRRGAAQAEYVVLLGTVTIAAAAAIAGWGPPLLDSFERTRSVLISPAP